MKIVISSGAQRDIRRILEHYRQEAGDDVAAKFHSDLYAAVDRLKTWPKSFPQIEGGLRRAITKRFPFQIIYRIESEDRIRILAIRHHRQHPDFGLNP